MSRYDLRFMAHHPLRWLRFWWLHLTVAAMLAALAVTWTAPIFAQVLQPNLWPIATGGVAALVLATALAPWERNLQAAAAAALITLGLLRTAAMAEVWWHGTANRHVVVALAIHGLIVAALGVVWPDWTAACAGKATVEAGDDDRGEPCGR